MEANKILDADILEIIFEGKNKLYGAYDLRKFYNRRLTKSMMITGALVLMMFTGTVLAKYIKGVAAKNNINVKDVRLSGVKEKEVIPPPPPPPPALPPPPREMKQVQFITFKIVKDNVVKPDEKIKEIEDDAIISNQTVEGNNTIPIIQASVEDVRSQVIEVPKQKSDDVPPFNKVEVEAGFPGGNIAWIRYLKNNLDANTPVDKGAPEGIFQVIVRFIVNKDGSISDVVAETNFGYGMEAEAIKIIQKGPNWTPALQNGQNIKAYRRQPITFVVTEGG